MAQDLINQFVGQILKEANLDQLPEDFKKDYREKLAEEVQRRLGIQALKELDDKALEEFVEFSKEEHSQKEMAYFFQKRISDFENKVATWLKDFAWEFINSAYKLKASVG